MNRDNRVKLSIITLYAEQLMLGDTVWMLESVSAEMAIRETIVTSVST